jgi:DNA-binding response OmpR family regulator
MKSRFFANISHEFRTPLTLILGPLKKLLAGDFPGDPKEQFRLMLRNGQRLLLLINQLLDLSKLDAGGMSLEARPQNLVSVVKYIVLSFSSLAERNHITLKFMAPNESIRVYLDRDKLEKITVNLLSNAFKFTPEGGEVEVAVAVGSEKQPPITATASATEFVQISVRDSGIGIPAERLPHIFDRFYQVDSSHTREQEGTGIGLALTKELVELHGGDIHVRSELGRGSTFVVRLPLGKEHLRENEIVKEIPEADDGSPDDVTRQIEFEETPDTEAIAGREEETPTEKESPIILIVEDHRDMRTYIREMLDKDHRVIEAGDGAQGFEKAVDSIPDLIISDVMMPGMDGFELCHKLKTDERTSHIPVILLTARASGASKVEGLETGADDYITKPFDASELRARVKNLIEQRRKLRERFSREVTLQPGDIAITSMDEQFLHRAIEVIEEHIADANFSLDEFTRKVGMSRMQLHRKLRALTDQSATDVFQNIMSYHGTSCGTGGATSRMTELQLDRWTDAANGPRFGAVDGKSYFVQAGASAFASGSSTDPYGSVENAIVATSGTDIVLLRPGNYNEAFKIKQPVTLRVTRTGSAVIGSSSAPAFIASVSTEIKNEQLYDARQKPAANQSRFKPGLSFAGPGSEEGASSRK